MMKLKIWLRSLRPFRWYILLVVILALLQVWHDAFGGRYFNRNAQKDSNVLGQPNSHK